MLSGLFTKKIFERTFLIKMYFISLGSVVPKVPSVVPKVPLRAQWYLRYHSFLIKMYFISLGSVVPKVPLKAQWYLRYHSVPST